MIFKDNILAFISKKNDGNIAYHVGDSKENVDKNRINLANKLGIDNSQIKFMNQVHGDTIEIVDENYLTKECDAVITNRSNIPIMVMVADCIAILFHDEASNVIAVAHAGRNGTFLNIASKVINKMVNNFNCDPEYIKVYLSPSIQKCCYEVSKEMADIVSKNFGANFVNGRHIDLQGINKKQLIDVGVKADNIGISTVCTKCAEYDYFSYRADNNCGRFCAIMMIK